MKLIIDIPEERLEWIKVHKGLTDFPTTLTLYDKVRYGTPLEKVFEDIKEEIRMVMDMYKGCEYIGDKARRDEFWHVLEIIEKHTSGKEPE